MIARLIISALAVGVTALTLDGVTVSPWWWAVIVAVVLGFINSWIKPIVEFLAWPLNFLTLGLFSFVINACMVLLCSKVMGPHFEVQSFWWALAFSIVLTIVNWILNWVFPRD